MGESALFHESISKTQSLCARTQAEMLPGKESYWRILSGKKKRTFSNKWWWTLDRKPLFFVFLAYQRTVCFQFYVGFLKKVNESLGYKALNPTKSNDINLVLIVGLHYKWNRICILRGGVSVFCSGSVGFLWIMLLKPSPLLSGKLKGISKNVRTSLCLLLIAAALFKI